MNALVTPTLQAIVIADHAYQDAQTGKVILAGAFSKIAVRLPPQRTEGETDEHLAQRVLMSSIGASGSPWIYLALTNIHGKQSLQLQWVHLPTETMLFNVDFAVEADERLSIVDAIMSLPRLVYPGMEGWHSMELSHNSTPLGSRRIHVEQVREG